jgi:hypothetical protein
VVTQVAGLHPTRPWRFRLESALGGRKSDSTGHHPQASGVYETEGHRFESCRALPLARVKAGVPTPFSTSRPSGDGVHHRSPPPAPELLYLVLLPYLGHQRAHQEMEQAQARRTTEDLARGLSRSSAASSVQPRARSGGMYHASTVVGSRRAGGPSQPASYDRASRVARARGRGRPVGGRADVPAVQRIRPGPLTHLDLHHRRNPAGRRVPRHR